MAARPRRRKRKRVMGGLQSAGSHCGAKPGLIVRPSGLLGTAEFSWAGLFRERRDQPTAEERAQDAWLSNPELNRPRGEAPDVRSER